MILLKSTHRLYKSFRFRLLNSEIGNDRKYADIILSHDEVCFRLLNSEIGNDHNHYNHIVKYFLYVFVSLTRR